MVHLPEQRPAHLEPELLAPIPEEHEVDDQRAHEVADDDAERPLVEHDHEQQRRADREQDVREARDHERDGALLDPEQVRQLHVVQLRPERHRARADEVRGARVVEEPGRDLAREDEEDDQPERRHRHREPERRAQDEPAAVVVVGVEVEAEERRRDAELQAMRGDVVDMLLCVVVCVCVVVVCVVVFCMY